MLSFVSENVQIQCRSFITFHYNTGFDIRSHVTPMEFYKGIIEK